MSSPRDKEALQSNDLRADRKKDVSSKERYAPSVHDSKSSGNASPLAAEEVIYPEGGLQAWTVVFGAFCGTAASIGLYNTAGLFEAYMSTSLLPNQSASNIGWIFGIYGFVIWFLGVQIGPTFDAVGPTALMSAGAVCMAGGMVALSSSTQYYQIILAYSILTATGTSLVVNPANASVVHWFNKRRGLAIGITWVGSGIGGVIFPLMLQSLLPQIGWAWSLRALALVQFCLCGISIAFCRTRVPPRPGTWRDALPTARIFMDGTGAMAVTTAGVLLTDIAYFIPVTHIPRYYLVRQHQSPGETLTGSSAFAYQLLAISNASSVIGRVFAGAVSDQLGSYNTMIISLFFCAVSVLCFWLPDIVTDDVPNIGLLLSFVILFGCVSGSNTSLFPVCVGQLCEVQEYGRYYATTYTVVSFGVLISIPIAGALFDNVEAQGKRQFWGVAVFTGLCYVAATICFAWVT
ncbi:hypothetical protein S40288_09607 [Stachybotrys chartarum IBT 40288]|nr:hypothetical protein S40288_09607 [Stachybotrys chartarum IBT 40288]